MSQLLEPFDAASFAASDSTALEAVGRCVSAVPLCPHLVAQVDRARIVACDLDALPDGLRAYTELTAADFSSNRITAVPADFFLPFHRLQTLDLSSNRIAALTCSLPESLAALDLSYNPGIDAESVWRARAPQLRVLKLGFCGIAALPDAAPAWADSVATLVLDGNRLSALPPSLSALSALADVSLFGNCLRSAALPFGGCLKSLNLAHNDVADSAAGAAARSVNLSCNGLRVFPAPLLSAQELQSLCLARNGISGELDFELPPALRMLDLSSNRIQRVSARFAASCAGLSVLNLAHNAIEAVDDCFGSDVKMVRVFLNGNALREMPKSLLSGRRIEELSVAHNRLAIMPQFDLPQLRMLDVSFNEMEELPDCFENALMLTEINVAFNRLKTLPNSMGCCRKVFKFIGAGNLFERVPPPVMAFSQLQILVLSENRLNSVSNGVRSLFFLRVLDLSNNHFVDIPRMIHGLKKLKVLNFSHNAISVIPDNLGFPESLNLLDLSYNRIRSIKLNLPQLNCLSLDYNELEDFEPINIPKCRFISLNCNPIKKNLISMIPSFMKLEELQELEYLGNNNNIKIPLLKFNVTEDYRTILSSNFNFGYSSTMGLRGSMEDSLMISSLFDKGDIFGILDGHSGNITSTSANKCILHEMLKIINTIDSDSIEESLPNLISNVNDTLRRFNIKDGSTLAFSFIRDGKCYVLGVGDSRIVRVRKNDCIRVTTDQKPLTKSEFRRLQDKGFNVNNEGRINRKLAISNTLGDFWIGDGFFEQPTVTSFDIDEEDVGLIIACDGLWDVVSDEHASSVVRRAHTSSDAATTLKNYALSLQSKDNVSVLVVKFHAPSDELGLVYKNEVEILPPCDEELEPESMPQLPAARPGRRRR